MAAYGYAWKMTLKWPHVLGSRFKFDEVTDYFLSTSPPPLFVKLWCSTKGNTKNHTARTR